MGTCFKTWEKNNRKQNIKWLHEHPCATISDGVHANAFSLAATAKISGVNNIVQNQYGDLRASGDLGLRQTICVQPFCVLLHLYFCIFKTSPHPPSFVQEKAAPLFRCKAPENVSQAIKFPPTFDQVYEVSG